MNMFPYDIIRGDQIDWIESIGVEFPEVYLELGLIRYIYFEGDLKAYGGARFD